jgi:hypothetical protein
MTIKISQLANLTVTQANTIVPVVSNVTGTLTTVQANVQQLQTYMLENAGNLIPRAGNIYSIGNSTTWWKDLWLSANTLYIGGVPVGTLGSSLTFGGNVVGTSDLPTYTGNVSAGAVSLSGAVGGISSAAVVTGGQGFSAGLTFLLGISQVNGATCTVSASSVSQPPDRAITSVAIVNSGNAFHVGDLVTVVNTDTPDPANGYPVSNATIRVTEILGAPLPAIYVGNTAWKFGAEGGLTTPGSILLPDSTAIYNEDSSTAVFTSNIIAETTRLSLTDGGNASVYTDAGTWTFDTDGTTTFPGNTTIDINGDISAGNIDVYGVTTDTVGLGATELYGVDGSVTFSEVTTVSIVGNQYWGFNPSGITWFYVADTTGVDVGMQIYWAGYPIGSVTGVTSGNVSCTPLQNVTPNFVANALVAFGNLAPISTDTISSPTGELFIDGNIALPDNTAIYNEDANTAVFTSNIISDATSIYLTDAGNAAVYASDNVVLETNSDGNVSQQWIFNANGNLTLPAGEINTLSSGNLYIGADSGQAVRLAANAGAAAWNFNSNGSVTFPDNTLQTTAGTNYSNTQVVTFLPTYSGNVGSILVNNGLVVVGNIQAGVALSNADFGNVIFTGVGRANSHAQLNIQNVDSVGTNNSADIIATAPNGTDTSKYIDMGINGNNFSSSSWTISGKNDGYVYINSGNLTLGTDTPDTTVKVHVGGTLAGNVVTTFSNSNVTICGNLIVCNVYVPTANNSVGTAGQIAWDSGYVYICIATDTWKRANISTW